MHEVHRPRSAPTGRRLQPSTGSRRALLAAGVALALTGCSQDEVARGFLPDGVTTDEPIVTTLWTGSWITALGVGVLVWGLIAWCVTAYRRKKNDTNLPEQLRYNLPLEILYTVVPLFMVAVLFFFTARDEAALLDTSQKAENVVNVVGKRWAWDFNYVTDNTYESTIQVDPATAKLGELPAMYLPVNKRTEFVLTARDVNHSFWVPQFLKKLDMIPGRVNRFQVVPTEVGTFTGKCAELCGAYHSEMLFQVNVVEQAEYDERMEQLRAEGKEGQLDNSLNPSPLAPGEENNIPTPAEGSAS